MNKIISVIIFIFSILLIFISCGKKSSPAAAFPTATFAVTPVGGPVNTAAPSAVVKLMFIHHSTGSAWIASGNGNLGTNLNAANFYTTEADYGWEPRPTPVTVPPPTPIGSSTDTVHWQYWFNDTIMPYAYANTSHYDYTNTISEPGGGNEVIMFKSCFPNSEVGSDITDEQALYNGLLAYFAAHTDKLFILIIPPPMQSISNPAKTRELSNWLADRTNGWLINYSSGNVFAFDYYNVLTHPDNHHYVNNGCEYHIVANAQDTLYYPTGDDHPNATGQQKATDEFVPLLIAWWNQWKGN